MTRQQFRQLVEEHYPPEVWIIGRNHYTVNIIWSVHLLGDVHASIYRPMASCKEVRVVSKSPLTFVVLDVIEELKNVVEKDDEKRYKKGEGKTDESLMWQGL